MIKKTAFNGILILCTLLLVTCTTDEDSMIGPFGDASKYISATTFTAERDTLYTDGDSTKITIILLDVSRSPIEGLKVIFSTNLGKITESDFTDSAGTAEAVYISGETAGKATIVASTGAKNYEIPIQVTKYEPTTIELSAESLVLFADGNEYTKITAIPRDEDGNLMKNIAIEIITDLGTLSSEAGSFSNLTSITTNSGDSGKDAIVYLRSNTTGGTAMVQASAGVSNNLSVYFYLEVPAYIIISADPAVLLADGSSIATIIATTLDYQGAAMEGVVVSFSTTLGSLSTPVAQTNADGTATVILTSESNEGTATVTAFVSTYISNTIDVQFTFDIPYQIEITASEERVMANGSTSTTITAVPRDDSGNPMSDVIVSFRSDLGSLSAYKDTSDANGETQVELTSNREGLATVTASVSSVEAITSITFYEYNPAYIIVTPEETSILADGFSKTNISASIYDIDWNAISGATINFSTSYGQLSHTSRITDQLGTVNVSLTSEGFRHNQEVDVTAIAYGTNLSETEKIVFRGITMSPISVDSSKFVEGGYYKVYVSTVLTETSTGEFVDGAGVQFWSTIGKMESPLSNVNEFGSATSVMVADVTGIPQNNLIITSELPNATNISEQTNSLEIPGVETFITTVDDEIMGDGESWALVKATLRETTGKAITNMFIDWETTVGTIIGQSLTNTNGHSIDTLRIESLVNSNAYATIRTNFGENVWDSETVTIIPPENNNRLILGFEPDTTGHGIIPCDIDTNAIATRDVGITALFVNEEGNGFDGQAINFSVVPNNLAAICPTATTIGTENGRATVMMSYPPQFAGQIVRVWGEAPDGTRGNIDVILPKDEEEEDG